MRVRLPDSIHGRFALLLIASLLFCNIAAAWILAREGTAFDQAIRVQHDMGRLVALIDTIEETDRETGEAIVQRSATGYTRFSIESKPLTRRAGAELGDIADEIRRALPGHEIRVTRPGPRHRFDERGPALLIISVRLDEGVRKDEWLNSLVYPLSGANVWRQKGTFFIPLIASLAVALLIGLFFLNQMTRPLEKLARASLAAGKGDHSVRLDETGPREIRDAAASFNTMQSQIADFEEDRRRMLASVGHDLRTPITSLRLRVEGVEDDTLRLPMIRTLEDMTVMTEDILRFTREGGEAEERRDTDLRDMLADLCGRAGVNFAAHEPVSAPVRMVAIRRAVSNLIDNALRYAGSARVSLARIEGGAAITVSDRGPGIPESRLTEVLEPFVRGEESRSRDTGGIGLGLAITRRIVAEHGGNMALRNRPGGGLEVELVLPAGVAPVGGLA
ncbi:ATP-binding protein [Pseudogemmobacter bohemicus]|uniref:ATP-binding protein n=1 Tax=Pseudogemmobacter bohemicus TaxID=2250708 RepID=UPI000DD33055|nr:ATP-binding protein [Pseudogemmobacter bohemicus]